MAMRMIKRRQAECQKCGHKWFPRVKDVRICPKCKSVRWDKPKKGGKGQ
jgi:predicted Zn-ribbon and HTH transcriptional regulator